MADLEELQQQLAGDVQDAIEQENQNVQQEMHDAEIKLERDRIRAEERMHERELEHQERILDKQVSDRPIWVDDFLAELKSVFSSPTPQITVDASREENELAKAAEDIPQEIPDAPEAQETPQEMVEELGGNTEEENPVVKEPINDAEENTDTGHSGRRKRRRNR